MLPSRLEYAVTHGVAYLVLSSLFAHRSGAHMNPAVTLAQLVTRRIGPLVSVVFIGMQRA